MVGFVIKEMMHMNTKELLNLIQNNYESEVLDFKENLKYADEIREYISALGNSAILSGNQFAFLIWGVRDVTREVIVTNFNPWLAKAQQKSKKDAKAQMPLITFLEKMIDPRLTLEFTPLIVNVDGTELTINLTEKDLSDPFFTNFSVSIALNDNYALDTSANFMIYDVLLRIKKGLEVLLAGKMTEIDEFSSIEPDLIIRMRPAVDNQDIQMDLEIYPLLDGYFTEQHYFMTLDRDAIQQFYD